MSGRIMLWPAALMVVSGCSDAEVPPGGGVGVGGPCSSNDDCIQSICYEDVCRQPCEVDDHCDTVSEHCDEVASVCLPGAVTGCGTGLIDTGESCDDGNTMSGDGCSSTCMTETGYGCSGQPSVCSRLCGNGACDLGEPCDDGNWDSSDGCSSACAIEPGYACNGCPAVCVPLCGNGIVNVGETCDDFNINDGDGCAGTCMVEAGYTCGGQPSTCTRLCGNGTLNTGEACDDGNDINSDGCSSGCVIEAGYTCSGQPSTCQLTNPACNPGDGNCDGINGNGCETDLTSSLTDCGACDNACIAANVASATCTTGTCTVSSCNTDYLDRNGTFSDGCECLVDAIGDFCTGAVDLGTVSFASTLTSGGTLLPSSDVDWYQVTFGDSCTVATAYYSPRITLVDASGYLRIAVYQACPATFTTCSEEGGANADSFTEWESSCSPATPSDTGVGEYPRTVYVKVFPAWAPDPTSCMSYTLDIANLNND